MNEKVFFSGVIVRVKKAQSFGTFFILLDIIEHWELRWRIKTAERDRLAKGNRFEKVSSSFSASVEWYQANLSYDGERTRK